MDLARWTSPLEFGSTNTSTIAKITTTTTQTTTTTTTTTTTIYYSKSTIDDDDNDLSHGAKVFDLDVVECPTTYINEMNTQVNAFISNAYYRFNKKIIVNIMFPSTCSVNFCSKMSSVASGGHTCKTTGEFYYKSTLRKTEETSGVVCSQSSTCSNIVAEVKLKKFKPIVVIDIGNNNVNTRLLVTTTAQSSSSYYLSTSTSTLSQKLFCNKNPQQVPLPFYKKETLHCGCFCPVGYELIKGDCVKKQMEYTKISQHCNWIKKRFTYRNSNYCLKSPTISSITQNKCNVLDLFTKLGFTTLPFPDETYLNFQDNFNDSVNPLTGPRIQLNITKFINANKPVPNWFSPRAFTWKDFQLHRETIFSKYIQIDTVGKYVVTLKAYGYSNKPAICTTVITAYDNFPPTVLDPHVICPSSAKDAMSMPFYLYTTAKNKVKSFNTWIKNIVNDEFGENKRTDLSSYKIRSIGSTGLTTINNANNAMDITADEMNALTSAVWALNLGEEKIRMNTEMCKKCISLYYEPREYITYYTFPPTGQTAGKWIVDQISSSGAKCNLNECYMINPTDFFSPSVRITNTYMNTTKYVINTRYNGLLYNNLTDIHLTPPCNDLTSSKCQMTALLSDVFNVVADFANEYKDVFSTFKANAYSMIRFRYNINGGSWQEITSTSKITFSQLYNAITMEAYTACGQVGTQIKFNVYIHPVEQFDICYSMEKFGWYQSTTGIPLDGEARICNYPNTDFAEFSFAYNGLTESKTMLSASGYSTSSNFLTFDGISCTVEYVLGNKHAPAISVVNKTNTPVLEHYAVNLIRSPMSNEMTKLFMTCTASYITSEKKVIKGSCSKQLVFHDCNDPGWNCPYGDCLLKCPTTQPRPNQICQGKVISYNAEKTVFENIVKPKTCCAACGISKCQDLTAAEPLGLKQCVTDHPLTDEVLPRADSDDEEMKLAAVDENEKTNEETIETTASIQTKPVVFVAQGSNFSHILSLFGLSTVGIVLLLEIHRRRRNARQQVRVQDEDDHQLDYQALLNE